MQDLYTCTTYSQTHSS